MNRVPMVFLVASALMLFGAGGVSATGCSIQTPASAMTAATMIVAADTTEAKGRGMEASDHGRDVFDRDKFPNARATIAENPGVNPVEGRSQGSGSIAYL